MNTHAHAPEVIALLGPTNTGKTHYAVERMLAHMSGMIGFPLRLLAREVYDRVVAIKGRGQVALITGEERIEPEGARYYLCTVESMPITQPVEFLAIDEVQLASDPERGHVFTDRILRARGMRETILMGSDTMRPVLKALVPHIRIESRQRFSTLAYTKPKKLMRLPKRTAVIAFSAEDVYRTAEMLRRQTGGVAIVMGALSPRTRNAQVAMYQAGEVDYLVATDAIGMGLNMDIDHVVFAGTSKFDGERHRPLTPAELGQIAGRAGRHMNNGTFTTLANEVAALSPETIRAIEEHKFPNLKTIEWRNTNLRFKSLKALLASLDEKPPHAMLRRMRRAFDEAVLAKLMEDEDIVALANHNQGIERLWALCQIPDFTNMALGQHLGLLRYLGNHLLKPDGLIPGDVIAKHTQRLDNLEGDIETLMSRLAEIRTWTYIAHRRGWLKESQHWTYVTRSIEDRLSDALHKRLMQRFVDRRTTALMRELKAQSGMDVSVTNSNELEIDGHIIGRIRGFGFQPEAPADSENSKEWLDAAEKVARRRIEMLADAFLKVEKRTLELSTEEGLEKPAILLNKPPIAYLTKGQGPYQLKISMPSTTLLDSERQAKILAVLEQWLEAYLGEHLGPLYTLKKELDGETGIPEGAAPLEGLARGIAFQLVEHFGILPRPLVHNDLKTIDLEARKGLHRHRIRIGAATLFMRDILKPEATRLRLMLWALHNGYADLPAPPTPGMVWTELEQRAPQDFLQVAGFLRTGKKAVRVDMIERLADAVRPLGEKGEIFETTPEIMGLVGLSGDDFIRVMQAIGYKTETSPEEGKQPENKQKEDSQTTKEEKGKDKKTKTDAPAKKENDPKENGETGEKEAHPALFFRWTGRKTGKPARPGHPAKGKGKRPKKQPHKMSKTSKKPTRKKEKQPDPDSPFAVLASLKGNMQKPKKP